MIDKRQDAIEYSGHSDGASSDDLDCALRDLTSSRTPGAPGADNRPGEPDHGLLMCGDCRSRLVYPRTCEEHGRDHWYIELTCPSCGGSRWTVFDTDMLDALDRELDLAETEVEADLEWLSRANMADYVRRFVAALKAGAIEPQDFAT
jgi:hypothetical protein